MKLVMGISRIVIAVAAVGGYFLGHLSAGESLIALALSTAQIEISWERGKE